MGGSARGGEDQWRSSESRPRRLHLRSQRLRLLDPLPRAPLLLLQAMDLQRTAQMRVRTNETEPSSATAADTLMRSLLDVTTDVCNQPKVFGVRKHECSPGYEFGRRQAGLQGGPAMIAWTEATHGRAHARARQGVALASFLRSRSSSSSSTVSIFRVRRASRFSRLLKSSICKESKELSGESVRVLGGRAADREWLNDSRVGG
eukprot:6093384-Pleurochrysis_carterae.AAC.2